jgi:hypothetical protein
MGLRVTLGVGSGQSNRAAADRQEVIQLTVRLPRSPEARHLWRANARITCKWQLRRDRDFGGFRAGRPRVNRPLLFVLLLGTVLPALADPRVAVVANAREEYVERRMVNGKVRPESYVFMQGNYYGGHTVDRSLERMPFRKIAEFLAPELAKQEYRPTTQPREADLLLVVHWGATVPYVGTQEMMARTTWATDTSTAPDSISQVNRAEIINGPADAYDPRAGDMVQLGLRNSATADQDESARVLANLNSSGVNDGPRIMDRLNQLTDHITKSTSRESNMSLLGYNETMHRLGKQMWSDAAERILSHDLEDERYFIIVNAYDLKDKVGGSARPVWKMHLNISSPGNNFSTALNRMSQVAGSYAGRNTGTVVSVRPTTREGKVTLAPMVIIGEVKPPSK